MKVPEHPTLIRRMRDARVKKLAAQGPLLAASLVEVKLKCGRTGCHCEKGEGHLKHHLTFKEAGKTNSQL